MAIPNIILWSIIPIKGTSTFYSDMNIWLNETNIVLASQNAAINAMNISVDNVNLKEASAVQASTIALASANFKGTWLVGTSYTIPASVELSGLYYMAVASSTGQTPPNATYWKQITGGDIGLQFNGATAKTTPADEDLIGIADSNASFALKKVTWENIKATLGSLFAPLASPALTGTPTAPTASAGDNSTQVATTEFVNAEIANDVGVANSTLVKTSLNATGTAPIYACRAWVNFNGTGTVVIRASGNVSSITDNGVGSYTINFTTAMEDANYSTALSIEPAGSGYQTVSYTDQVISSSLRIRVFQSSDSSAIDTSTILVSVFR